MRYFISKNGASVIEKKAIVGNDSKIESLINTYKAEHPGFSVSEVDQVTFDSTNLNPPLTNIQQAWLTAKAGGAVSAATFIGKFLGLE